ncbi:MAG TPA: thermosome subunit beta [Thermoplasmata archaeon]|nr:thermosome subunit beta [Thermoplasmata archaeon]
MLAGTPVLVLREGSGRSRGDDARRQVLEVAKSVSEVLRSTLGPRGRDKMMVDGMGDVVITNDGATILKEMEIQHPAGKMLAEVAKTQDQECGDGTKSSVILTGELLHQAEALLDEKVHPTQITLGYQRAAERALALLNEITRPVGPSDVEELKRIAMTAMISKGVKEFREGLASMAVRASKEVVEEVGGQLRFDRKNIQIVKRQGGEIHDSELIEGHIVEQERVHPEMPKLVEGARIALLESALEIKKTEFNAEIRIQEAGKLEGFLQEEARQIQRLVDAVVASGANVVFDEKGIDDVAAEHLANAGVYAVRRVKRSDIEALAKSTGARIVARATDLDPKDLGVAGRVEERKIGEDRLTFVSGCPRARAVTLLVRGGAQHVVDEGERSLVDAISVVGLALEDGRLLTGAGAAAIELSLRLKDYAATVGGREQMAVDAFARGLEVIPATLAENAGMDVIDTLIELRRRHKSGDLHAGVDVLNGRVDDMRATAVEPIRVARQEILGAVEAATMLLRIDDVIASKKSGGPPPPGSPPMPGGGGF